MLKKINIVIVSLIIPFSLNLKLGFMILIPVLLFYLFKDIKNVLYTYLPVVITSFLFMRQYFLLILIVELAMLVFYYFLTRLKKVNNKLLTVITCSFIMVLNLVTLLVVKENNILNIFLSSIIATMLYIYLEYFLYKSLFEKPKVSNLFISSSAYLEIMLGLVTILSGAETSIFGANLGFICAIYFAMLFGRNYKNIYSLLYGISAMAILYLGFKVQISILVPFVSSIYMISNMLLILLFNAFITLLIFTNSSYSTSMLLSMMIVSIVFEIISLFTSNDEKLTNEDICDNIYEQVQKSTNEEILNFALFLDKLSSNFKNPKEYNERISNGIKILVQKNCLNCQKKKECFSKYKIDLYQIFKSLLMDENKHNDNLKEFYDYCTSVKELENTIKLIQKNINIPYSNGEKSQNNIMLAQISGLSNTIKKYVVDLSSQQELNFYQLMLLKKRIREYGYNVTYYEVKKLFKEDFNVFVGIENESLDAIKNTIKLLAYTTLGINTSIIFDHLDNKTTYFSIIPKIEIDVTYGYGALSCDGEEICGDNYLIKEINNGHFISAISDGMGKGYRAFYESDLTLKLVEDIIKLNLSTQTALEILNSFYLVQEYLEEYATLDLLEINRYNKSANFFKMGATTTYIFRMDGTIDKIINKALPFGLDEEIMNVSVELKHGDLILMSSDGIFENIIDEEKLKKFIMSIKNEAPQKIVYELLNYTLNNKIKTKDDMSLIALKIEDVA